MNKKKIAFGIGIVLTTLALFTASAVAAPNTAYFVPQHSNAEPGETVYVEVWLNITDLHGSESLYAFVGADVNITYDSSIGEITAANRIDGDPWDGSWLSNHWYDPDNWWFTFYSTAWGSTPPYGLGPGLWPVANLTIECVTPGEMDLHFSTLNSPPSLRNCNMFDAIGNDHPNQLWVDGTFACPTTYNTSLPKGWNMISLPLKPLPGNDSVDEVLGTVYYDAVYKYDGTTFVTTETMEPGVGYFVHVAYPSIWTYNGTPYTQMDIALEYGLNMISWLNCTKPIAETNLDNSSLVFYITRWNTTAQTYNEVYNPVAPPPFNDFDTMDRGRGYFVSAKTAFTLTENCSV